MTAGPPMPRLPAGATVLVVDDEAGIRSVLRRLLAAAGLDARGVEEAASGEAALDVLARRRFDLVLTDFRMPRASGLEVLAWVREHHPGTRRALMTGNNEAPTAGAPEPGLVEAWFRKPWDNDALLARIAGLLAAPPAPPEPAGAGTSP